MKSRFFRKFFFATSTLILVSLALILYLVSYFVADYLAEDRKTTLYNNCHSIAVVSANNSDHTSIDIVVDSMHALAASNGNTIFATDTNGFIIACGCDDWFVYERCIHSDIRVNKKILKTSLVSQYNEVGNLSGKFEENYIISAIPLQNKLGITIGSAFSCSPMSEINGLITDLANIFVLSAFVPLILLFIVEYIISYTFTKPLKLMSNAAKKMAEGDFSMKIPVRTKDEIGNLSKSFNEMSEALSLNENIRKDFVANVSHELRTPMTNIGGFIDGILDGTIPQDSVNKYLEIVSSEIKRLTRIVSSMFELSKLESGEKQPDLSRFDFTDVLISILISKESDISNKNLSVEGVESLSKTYICADKDLIHQVLYNLIDNAIKFNEQNGYIKVSTQIKNNILTFKIVNTGYTIPKEDLPYIFDRFFKVDKARSKVKDSTGLGLHLVKTVLDIHNGSISANSIEGEYTEFVLTLPTSKE